MSSFGTTPYYQLPDAELVGFGNHLVATLEPQPGTWGLTSPIVTELSEVNDTWVARYNTAINPLTRTSLACEAKAQARRAFLAAVKNVVSIINGTPSVTDLMKGEINIPIPKPRQKNTIVQFSPRMEIVSRSGWTVTLKINEPGHENRIKPRNATSILAFWYQGASPSTDVNEWTFACIHTRGLLTIELPQTLAPGTEVFLTTCYANSAGTGPAASPISTLIAGAGGAFGEAAMKIAA